MKRSPSLLIIFLTVFIDLIGFGIIVTILPIYSKHYGANGFVIGAIFSAYSAMQFLFAPVWGRWSDRVGRRPILLLSTAGAALSYVLFAIGSGIANHTTALWILFVSRGFAGICGGNITVAQAYIADITPPENRSRKMGLIGMAFGLGFIFGPAIGGISSKIFGATGPGWVAAAICATNFLLAFSILVESRRPTSELVRSRPRLQQWTHTLAQPKIGLLVVIFFLATFAFSCFECTLALLVNGNFELNLEADETAATPTVTALFVFCGLIGAYIQGAAIGRLVKKYGEPKLIALSLFLTGLSLALLPFIKGHGPLTWSGLFHGDRAWIGMLLALALLAVGSSLTRPPLFGLLSNLTPANEQGSTMGVAQGAGALARVVGPLFAGPLFTHLPPLPYIVCGAISIVAGALAAQRLHGTHGAPVSEAAPIG